MDVQQYVDELAKQLPAMIQQQIINHVGINGVRCPDIYEPDFESQFGDPKFRFVLDGYFIQSKLGLTILDGGNSTVVLALCLDIGGFCVNSERVFDYRVDVPAQFDPEVFIDECHCIAWDIAKSLKALQDRINAKVDF